VPRDGGLIPGKSKGSLTKIPPERVSASVSRWIIEGRLRLDARDREREKEPAAGGDPSRRHHWRLAGVLGLSDSSLQTSKENYQHAKELTPNPSRDFIRTNKAQGRLAVWIGGCDPLHEIGGVKNNPENKKKR